MTATVLQIKSSTTNAAQPLAAANFRANRQATGEVSCEVPEMEWLFARDGSLTAMSAGERWWGNCSLPRRAAEFMLRTLEIAGPVACFLSPVHAAQLRVALNRLNREQAIVAIVPDNTTLNVLLHCEDFSADLASGRLWFACGADWETKLERLFESAPGLATPAHFIRPIVADPHSMDEMIAAAQRVFAAVSERRARQIEHLKSRWSPSPNRRRLCLLESSRYAPWEDAAETLARNIARSTIDTSVCPYRLDDPRSASPLGLAEVLHGCDVIIAANRSRSQMPDVAPAQMPWITWVTVPHIPAADPVAENDHLLLADPRWRQPALDAGWPAERIHLAGWPGESTLVPNGGRKSLAIVADTRAIEIPASVKEYSSQVLLWDAIARELADDPFAVGDDLQSYLGSRLSDMKVSRDGFDEATFIDRLIVPAWQQSVAGLLAREGFPLDLFGAGWSQLDDLAGLARGPVSSQQRLREIIVGSTALVHLWPADHAHAIDTCGRPVARPFANTRARHLRDVRLALSGLPPHAPRKTIDQLDASLLDQVFTAVNLGSSKFMTRAGNAR